MKLIKIGDKFEIENKKIEIVNIDIELTESKNYIARIHFENLNDKNDDNMLSIGEFLNLKPKQLKSKV